MLRLGVVGCRYMTDCEASSQRAVYRAKLWAGGAMAFNCFRVMRRSRSAVWPSQRWIRPRIHADGFMVLTVFMGRRTRTCAEDQRCGRSRATSRQSEAVEEGDLE